MWWWMCVRICSRVVIYLPKMPACTHVSPRAHPHEPITFIFSPIFILVFFYFILVLYSFIMIFTFFSPCFFCLVSVWFLLIGYCKRGVPIRQFIHASGLLTSIYWLRVFCACHIFMSILLWSTPPGAEECTKRLPGCLRLDGGVCSAGSFRKLY